MANGYIYIMTNPGLKNNIIKIGFSTDVEARRKQLSRGSNVPYAYEIYATYETKGDFEDKKLHNLIDALNQDLRITKDREFYIMEPKDAYKLLESISIISGTQDKLIKYVEPKQQTRRPNIDFSKCGIPVGAELVYIKDSNVVVQVLDEHKVLYNDEITTLSALVKSIKGGASYDGPSFFTYQGKLLVDIAEDTQWKNL